MIFDKAVPFQLLNKISFRCETFVGMLSCIYVYKILRLHVQVLYQKVLIKFELGHGLMIFDKVIPLELRKQNSTTLIGMYA
jgi:hypothetical protein